MLRLRYNGRVDPTAVSKVADLENEAANKHTSHTVGGVILLL